MYTKLTDTKTRHKLWEQALAAARKHQQLGEALQGQGIQVLQSLKQMSGDPSLLNKLMQQATATIEKGTKIEREAFQELTRLQQEEPREQ